MQHFSTTMQKVMAFAVIICDLLPGVLFSVLALAIGVTTGEYPEGRGIVASESFPPFDPQLWTAWIPVAVFAVWVVGTLPLPLKGGSGPGRGIILLWGLLLFIVTGVRVLGFYWSDRVISWGTQYAFVILLVLLGILVVRILLGWFRLLPRSWRVASAPAPAPLPPRNESGLRGDTKHDCGAED